MTVKKSLIAAKALIDTPEKWGKGQHTYFAKEGCPKCAHEALRQVDDSQHMYACRRALEKALPHGDWFGTVDFNDHPATTHADIMALFDRAIATCED